VRAIVAKNESGSIAHCGIGVGERGMKKVMALVLAASVLTAGANSAWALPPPAPGQTFGSGKPGFWVGSIAVTAVSLIACAAIVGHQHHRELNAKEVFWASLVPLGCLFVPR
jgi:hypothetical protein